MSLFSIPVFLLKTNDFKKSIDEMNTLNVKNSNIKKKFFQEA